MQNRWHGVQGAVALLYPPECVLCRRPLDTTGILCPSCRAALHSIDGPRCTRCGDRLNDPRADVCLRCGTQIRFVDRLFALGAYDDGWGDVLRTFKFDRERAVGRFLGDCLGLHAEQHLGRDVADVVTFVPMTRKERRRRGYNPARILATAVSRHLGLPLQAMLVKTRDTRPQAALRQTEREVNLRGAFRAVRSHSQRVLLVDDICTTGSTAEECARTLKESGCPVVTVLTVARA